MALPFKLVGLPTRGCRFVVLQWQTGKSERRTVMSCHRMVGPAKKKAAELRVGIDAIALYRKQNPKAFPTSSRRLTKFSIQVYDLRNNRRVT